MTSDAASAHVSTIIPTLNEELHIGRAVQSAVPLGPVFVVDAGSRDHTRAIAESLGAAVHEHPWSGYADQKNWALEHLPVATPWVLFLDADEYLSPELREEIRRAVRSASCDGFYMPRQNIFLGRVLRHAWWYPDYQLRLFRTGKGRFEERLVHEHVEVNGRVGFVRNPLMHENLKGIAAFLERHVRYAALEAQEILKARARQTTTQRTGRLLGSWPERRRWLKLRVWYRLPWRPAIRFAWMYFWKRGFLDGRQGLVYCQLLAAYEAMIDARLLELQTGGGHDPRR